MAATAILAGLSVVTVIALISTSTFDKEYQVNLTFDITQMCKFVHYTF